MAGWADGAGGRDGMGWEGRGWGIGGGKRGWSSEGERREGGRWRGKGVGEWRGKGGRGEVVGRGWGGEEGRKKFLL